VCVLSLELSISFMGSIAGMPAIAGIPAIDSLPSFAATPPSGIVIFGVVNLCLPIFGVPDFTTAAKGRLILYVE
jgi:hypothetical protein